MLFGSAAATSMLTIIGVCILLAPVSAPGAPTGAA